MRLVAFRKRLDVIMSERKDSFRHGYIFFVLWNCCVKVVDALF